LSLVDREDAADDDAVLQHSDCSSRHWPNGREKDARWRISGVMG